MNKFLALLSLAIGTFYSLSAQNLEQIAPVSLEQGMLPDSVHFLLSTSDIRCVLGRPQKSMGAVQIVDGDQPWPPRWFATLNSNIPMVPPQLNIMPFDASALNGKTAVVMPMDANVPGVINWTLPGAFVILNKKMEPVDTLVVSNNEIGAQSLDMSAASEKLYFAEEDTLLNASAVVGKDTMIRFTYQNIQIADKNNNVIFNWNPIEHLGLVSKYTSYQGGGRMFTKKNSSDWSHGNSVSFDVDGNILYSYKLIGIGKISRQDGHVIWRLDRNQLRANYLSDPLGVYKQHDFKAVRNAKESGVYTVFSNGDEQNPACAAIEFSEKETVNGVPVLKLIKSFPVANINSDGWGNFDLQTDGSYLVNYGVYNADTLEGHTLFEYRNAKGEIAARYGSPAFVYSYRITTVNKDYPERPVVKEDHGTLTVASKDATWYKLLSGKTAGVEREATGSSFKPDQTGWYCVAVKHGIGYAVSRPLQFKK